MSCFDGSDKSPIEKYSIISFIFQKNITKKKQSIEIYKDSEDMFKFFE